MTMSNLPHDRVPGPGRIHVFCEGETEVLYLQDFCRLIGLSGKKAVISVCPVKNPARAIEWICRRVPGVSKASAASPECWLVFDRDRHEGFHEAFELVKQHPSIHLAATKPCFEYWLLLHFDDFQDDLPLAQGWYVAKRQVQGKQVAPDRSVRMTMEFLERVAHPEAVLKRLKKHMPGYGKNKAGVFEQLFPFLGTALWRTLGGVDPEYGHGSRLPELLERLCSLAGTTIVDVACRQALELASRCLAKAGGRSSGTCVRQKARPAAPKNPRASGVTRMPQCCA